MPAVGEPTRADLDALDALARDAAFAGMAVHLAQLEASLGASAPALLARVRAAVDGRDPARIRAALAALRAELDARHHQQR